VNSPTYDKGITAPLVVDRSSFSRMPKSWRGRRMKERYVPPQAQGGGP
jgi:hypothetical protein